MAPDGTQSATRGLATWLSKAAPASARGEVTVALVNDGRMQSLNRTFRGKDYATDVLSFPVAGPFSDPNSLGDVVIATGVAQRQADEVGHTLQTELRVLALHGLLHLLGYDHDNDAGEMRRVEARIRRRVGLNASLTERAGLSAPRRR
jgi:probable rRNA maturation factor